MKVKFFSGINLDSKIEKIIEFISPITVTKEKINNSEMLVYETLNPENNTMIRLEILDENLTVFSGENTLFFELNKEVDNVFFNNGSEVMVITFLKKFEHSSNLILLEYDLFLKGNNNNNNNNNKIATYITNMELIND
ncbi:hypothetical protein [Mesomycoplasma hyopneumoniae]|uniref:hypothetical protein n=1 Tax=Mesomycoplasma hyopneumoniae TaxID=2099 RepID=UPI0015C681DD|nr:hypothetical protein [Mesomycoplasma hyopneumoniae]QLG43272.1 hypothetical protein HZK19_00770 [Mesomycoplasma hyopneumoniae]